MRKLQCIQNTLARIVTNHNKYTRASPILKRFHWLPIEFCCIFKTSSQWSSQLLWFSFVYSLWKMLYKIQPSRLKVLGGSSILSICTYLKISLSRFQRSLMAQLRLGILPLALETGRYYRIPIENRFCKLCQNEYIEDEIHFLCCCKHFDHERLLFFTKLAETGKNIFEMSDNEKFVYIMQLNCKELPFFVETIWNKRKLILESLSQYKVILCW